MPAPGRYEHPAQLSIRDPLICGYPYKATAFSAADWCAWTVTSEMPPRDSMSDALICKYLDKATAYSGADWCAWTAKMPLRETFMAEIAALRESSKQPAILNVSLLCTYCSAQQERRLDSQIS